MPRNRAVLVGIRYNGTSNQLPGTGKDIANMGKMLEYAGFETIYLTDDTTLGVQITGLPTKANILAQYKSVIQSAEEGDTVALFISSHGMEIPTAAGDGSAQDYFVALDALSGGYNPKNLISSAEYHEVLIQAKSGVNVWAAADACHSGAMAALGNVRGLRGIGTEFKPFSHLASLIKAGTRSEDGHGNITFVGACRPAQVDADLGYNGALTVAIDDKVDQSTIQDLFTDSFNYDSPNAIEGLKTGFWKSIQAKGIKTQEPLIAFSKDTDPNKKQKPVLNDAASQKYQRPAAATAPAAPVALPSQQMPTTVISGTKPPQGPYIYQSGQFPSGFPSAVPGMQPYYYSAGQKPQGAPPVYYVGQPQQPAQQPPAATVPYQPAQQQPAAPVQYQPAQQPPAATVPYQPAQQQPAAPIQYNPAQQQPAAPMPYQSMGNHLALNLSTLANAIEADVEGVHTVLDRVQDELDQLRHAVQQMQLQQPQQGYANFVQPGHPMPVGAPLPAPTPSFYIPVPGQPQQPQRVFVPGQQAQPLAFSQGGRTVGNRLYAVKSMSALNATSFFPGASPIPSTKPGAAGANVVDENGNKRKLN